MSAAAQWALWWLAGVGLWAGFLYGLHLIFTRRQRSISGRASALRSRVERHVTRRGAF